MKKPIDPNLDNFDNEELPIDIAASEAENANPLKDGNTESPAESSKPAGISSPITADDFKMREKQYYHSSSHRHRSSGSHSHSHHSHHSHHSSHSSHSGKRKRIKKSLACCGKNSYCLFGNHSYSYNCCCGNCSFPPEPRKKQSDKRHHPDGL